jgi:hypothetical protein
MVELFALLEAPLELRLDGGEVRAVRGGERLREAFLGMHPPAAREKPAYRARVEDRLADARLVRWLYPPGVGERPAEPGEIGPYEVELRQVGLRATGQARARLREAVDARILESRAAFTPAGRDPDRPPLPGGARDRLAGTRERTLELRPGDVCFSRAAETWTTRHDLTLPEGEARPLDRTRTRLWELASEEPGEG